MNMLSRIFPLAAFILLSLTLFGCKENKSSIVSVGSKNDHLKKIILSLPLADSTFHFNALTEIDSNEFKILPDSVIDEIQPNDSLNKRKCLTSPQNIRSIRDGDQYNHDKTVIKFYLRLPIDNSYYYVLAAVDKKPSLLWWQLIAFDKNSFEEVSAIEGIHGLYANRGKIFTWWYFASNNRPDFMEWKQDRECVFSMISQEQKVPPPLINIINEQGELK